MLMDIGTLSSVFAKKCEFIYSLMAPKRCLIVCGKWLKTAYLSDKTCVFDGVDSGKVVDCVKSSYTYLKM
jgi:hypothetical protein